MRIRLKKYKNDDGQAFSLASNAPVILITGDRHCNRILSDIYHNSEFVYVDSIFRHPNKTRKDVREYIQSQQFDNSQSVFVTYNSHILNEIRLMVKENILRKNNIKIIFISKEDNVYHKQSPEIVDDGSLTDWPVDFFDTIDKQIILIAS